MEEETDKLNHCMTGECGSCGYCRAKSAKVSGTTAIRATPTPIQYEFSGGRYALEVKIHDLHQPLPSLPEGADVLAALGNRHQPVYELHTRTRTMTGLVPFLRALADALDEEEV